jgi:hypothetical protein
MDISKIFDVIQITPILVRCFNNVRDRIKFHGIPEEARKIAFSLNNFSAATLYRSSPVIDKIGEITRPEIDQILNSWQNSDSKILLHGEAGTGKSGIALRIGQLLANEGTPVLFINTAELPNDEDPILYTQLRMTIEKPLIDSVKILSEKKECAIIIDQLDAKAGTDLCKKVVGFIKSVSNFPNVKILVVSRTYDLQHDPDISSLDFPQITCGSLTSKQATEYLDQLGIKSPDKTLIEIARNLLNLSLISKVIQSIPNTNISFIDEANLWKQYFSIIERKDEDIAKYILTLATDVTVQGERSFPIESIKSGYKRVLLSHGILVELAGRRFAFRHEELQDFLCAYAILPEKPRFEQVYAKFERETSQGVIKWLHRLYHSEFPDLEAKFIDDVLAAAGKIPFYTRAIILENLKDQINPTIDSAKVLKKYLADVGYGRFFFDKLDNPAWISTLHELKTFYEPPEPIETSKNLFELPDWPAGKYLVLFADQFEEAVVDVVQSIKTENTSVHKILINAMLKISPEKTAKLIPVIDEWLDSRFSEFLPYDLIPLVDFLLDNEYYCAATQVLEFVTKPILRPNQGEYSKYKPPICFRSGNYWVEEFYQKEFTKLVQLNPIQVASAFEQNLQRAIERTENIYPNDFEKYTGYYWRLDISKQITDQSNPDALDLLINGFLDSLDEVCKQDIEEGRQLLTNNLRSKHIIFNRIALVTLRKYGENYPELINEALSNKEFLENSEYSKEYQGLIRDKFNLASEDVKEQVIASILSGPSNLDKRVKNRFGEDHEVTDDDRRSVQDKWQLYNLEIINDSLKGEALDRYNELSTRYGKPDIAERPWVSIASSWVEVPSPFSAEALSKMSLEKIKQLFIDFIPNDSFQNSRKGLAETFQMLIKEQPEKYNDFAKLFTDNSIPIIYVYYYLSAISDLLKNKEGKVTDEILSLCEFITNQKEENIEYTQFEDDISLTTIQMEVADLLGKALHSNDFYLSFEQLSRIKKLLIKLAHNPDPSLTEEANSSLDPFTQSINCVRGMAMHGIFRYSLYIFHSQSSQLNEKTQEEYLEPDIKQLLEEKLNLAQETSLAVHSVFGVYFSNLYYLSPQWLKQNLLKIFPENNSKYWQAAWDAYILTTNTPSKEVFDLLIPQYDRAIRALTSPQEEPKYISGSPNEQLAEHIMAAYLLGFTDFGNENKLLELFFTCAPDEIRAHGIFWISQAIKNIDFSENTFIWDKCWALWQKRLEYAETQEVSDNALEISNYMRWLESCPKDLGLLFPMLQKSIEYFHEASNIYQLIKFAAKHSEQYPYYAVTLLQKAIFAAKEHWWRIRDEDEERILQSAMVSKNAEAIGIAREIINYRGEQGDYRWKYLLD